jgi:hypothetical protein
MTVLPVRAAWVVAVLLVGAQPLIGGARARVWAQEPSAADVLYRVGDEAAKEALSAGENEQQAAAAQVWRQWATRYWGHADSLRGTRVGAGQYLASNIEFWQRRRRRRGMDRRRGSTTRAGGSGETSLASCAPASGRRFAFPSARC